jgi:hypothetical protein
VTPSRIWLLGYKTSYMVFHKKSPMLLLLIWSSCNIIDDDAITDRDRLADLRLTNYSFNQKTVSGETNQVSTLLYDSSVNIPVPNGLVVNRKLMFSLPSLGNYKMKYRSGATSNLKAYTSFVGENKPYTFIIYQGDSIVEHYRFRYDNTGKLTKIVTDINPVDNLPLLYQTVDNLEYSSNKIQSVSRVSDDAAREQEITIERLTQGTIQVVSRVNGRYAQFRSGSGNCPDGSGANCIGFNYDLVDPNTGSSSASVIIISMQFALDRLSEIHLLDDKANNGGAGGCCYGYDTYYFHPTMFLRDKMTDGADLMFIYMIDWWQLGKPYTGNSNFTMDEEVTLNFTYEL